MPLLSAQGRSVTQVPLLSGPDPLLIDTDATAQRTRPFSDTGATPQWP